MSLHLVPVTFADARAFVQDWHRHNSPPVGHKFSIGVADDDGVLRGVLMAGRPVARHMDDGLTIEVTRSATDGTRNANSMLYGAAARAAFALGYQRVVTFSLLTESGSSLRAVGWRVIAERPARRGWDTPARNRSDDEYSSCPRRLWEAPR